MCRTDHESFKYGVTPEISVLDEVKQRVKVIENAHSNKEAHVVEHNLYVYALNHIANGYHGIKDCIELAKTSLDTQRKYRCLEYNNED